MFESDRRGSNGDMDSDDEEHVLPMWMEGDSLAPPCQCEDDVLDSILTLAELTPDDVRARVGRLLTAPEISDHFRCCSTLDVETGVFA